jgi:hypothetical protein
MMDNKIKRIAEYTDTPIQYLLKYYSKNDLSHELVELTLMEKWAGVRNLFSRPLTEREIEFHRVAHALACIMQDDPYDCPALRDGLTSLPNKCKYCMNSFVLKVLKEE